MRGCVVSRKQAGVLLHPTSLPNVNGKLGQLNEQAWLFVDWIAESGLSIWQILPLTHTHADGSPYQAVSAFALDPKLLADDWQSQLDEQVFESYLTQPPHWLEDYVLFVALRGQYGFAPWNEWPDVYKYRESAALKEFTVTFSEQLLLLKKQQFVLAQTWQKLKNYANKKGIEMFGDMPIFVAFDSADVWASPEQFKLDEKLNPTVVTGVPPDYFSETGQRWGNPHYNWAVMREDGFQWWQNRVSEALTQFDLVRIDHFRGLQASWEIDVEEETAINGQWVETPGDELLSHLQEKFPDLPLVAEDLGIITDEVVALKHKYGLPGMSVLQFGFNGLPDNPHALDEQVENSVAYTGTHDNDTTLGWLQSLDKATRDWVQEQLQSVAGGVLEQTDLPDAMPWLLIVAALGSSAQRVVIPMQDYLMLDSEHRMNTPGTVEGNWSWQFKWSQLPENLAKEIHFLVAHSQRLADE